MPLVQAVRGPGAPATANVQSTLYYSVPTWAYAAGGIAAVGLTWYFLIYKMK